MPLFEAEIESLKDHVAKHNAMVAGLKKRLFEGKVEFDYYKVDKATGERTLRHAIGTMNEALIPKTEPIAAKFQCTGIVWIPKGGCVLPRKGRVAATKTELDAAGADGLDKLVGDLLEKKYGAEVREFEYFIVEEKDSGGKEPRKMPVDSVFYYDLEKKGFRSFKTDCLVSVED